MTVLNNQLTAWQTFNTQLLALQSVAAGLSLPSTFNAATVSVGTATVATATAQPGAQIGSHTLTVSQLAQSQKVLSGSFTDANTPLQISGSFVLNGKTITLAASDTLSNLAVKINAANAGVTAAVLNVGAGNTRLALTSSNTGTVNALSAADSAGGTVLTQLGFIPATGATTTLRQPLTPSVGGSGAGSLGFANATQSIGALLGATAGAAPGTVTIKGQSITLNLNTMSLSDVANAINGAGIPGVKAKLVAIPDANGGISQFSQQQLQIVSSDASLTASAFSDPSGVLSTLGVTQTGFANPVTAAQDSNFSLNGVAYTRSSNTVNDAIPGVGLSLLTAGTVATPATTTINVASNSANVVTSVNNFITAYNGINDAIAAQFAFTPPAAGQSNGHQANSPALFGDSTLSSIQQQLANTLGATFGNSSLGTLGITVGSTGDLTLDSTKLTAALQNNPQSVANLFGLAGQASDPNVSFVSGSVKTQATSGSGYQVVVTQAATQASVTGATAAVPLTAAETLTFSGSLFGSTSPAITLNSGNTLQATIDQINNDSLLNQTLIASASSDGKLVITTKGYGSAQGFSVTSNQGGGAGMTSQSGFSSAPTSASGQDVAGTINGEPATGLGQSLVGKAGNAHTEALSLLVTATTPGTYGAVTVSHGLTDQINSLISNLTDTNTGSIIGAENAINSQISDVQNQISQMQTQLDAYSANLQMEFANMECSTLEPAFSKRGLHRHGQWRQRQHVFDVNDGTLSLRITRLPTSRARDEGGALLRGSNRNCLRAIRYE